VRGPTARCGFRVGIGTAKRNNPLNRKTLTHFNKCLPDKGIGSAYPKAFAEFFDEFIVNGNCRSPSIIYCIN
jgi:hypothetical protein